MYTRVAFLYLPSVMRVCRPGHSAGPSCLFPSLGKPLGCCRQLGAHRRHPLIIIGSWVPCRLLNSSPTLSTPFLPAWTSQEACAGSHSQLVEEAGPQTIPKCGQTGGQSGWPGQLQVLAVFQDLPNTDARTVLCFFKCKCRGIGNSAL